MPIAMTPQPAAGPGEEFLYMSVESTRSIIFRRMNAMLGLTWSGEEAAGLVLARRMDEVLMTDRVACPQGAAVRIPAVTIEAPAEVAVGSVTPVRYHVANEETVRTEQNPSLHASDVVPWEPKTAGQQALDVLFVSQGNVVFCVTAKVRAVLPGKTAFEPWSWLGERLYFNRLESEAWQGGSGVGQEWIEIDRGTFGRIAEEDRAKESVLSELSRIIAKDWVPPASMLSVYADQSTAPPKTVYYAGFHRSQVGVVYMGTLGEGLLVYLEKPAPKPQAARASSRDLGLPRPTDLVRGSLDDHSALQVQSRGLQRYRSLHQGGPFEPVAILLLDIHLPQTLNLYSPGY